MVQISCWGMSPRQWFHWLGTQESLWSERPQRGWDNRNFGPSFHEKMLWGLSGLCYRKHFVNGTTSKRLHTTSTTLLCTCVQDRGRAGGLVVSIAAFQDRERKISLRPEVLQGRRLWSVLRQAGCLGWKHLRRHWFSGQGLTRTLGPSGNYEHEVRPPGSGWVLSPLAELPWASYSLGLSYLFVKWASW